MKNVIRFLSVMTALLLVYLISYRICLAFMPEFEVPCERLVNLPAKQNSIPRVTAEQRILVEMYDARTGDVISQYPYWNSAMAGLSEPELRSFLEDPFSVYEEEDDRKGYYRAQLLSFSRNEVRIRKYYVMTLGPAKT